MCTVFYSNHQHRANIKFESRALYRLPLKKLMGAESTTAPDGPAESEVGQPRPVAAP
jgi:hypothetical protein